MVRVLKPFRALFTRQTRLEDTMEEVLKAEKFIVWGIGIPIDRTFLGYILTFVAGVALSTFVSTYLSRSAPPPDDDKYKKQGKPDDDKYKKQGKPKRRADFTVLRNRKKSEVHVHALARARHGGVAFVKSDSCIRQPDDSVSEKEKKGSSSGDEVVGEVSINLEKMTQEDRAIIDNAMDCFVFSALSPHDKRQLVECLEEPIKYGADEIIFRQGDEGDYYYIIKEGTVGVSVAADRPMPAYQSYSLAPGDQGNSVSTAESFPGRRGSMGKSRIIRSKEVLHVNHHEGSDDLMKKEDSKLKQQAVPPVDEQNTATVKKELNRGDAFGELALLYNCRRAATCSAKTDCSLWRIGRHAFRYAMSGAHDSSKIQTQNELTLETLRQTPFGTLMSDATLEQLAGTFLPVTYQQGEEIIRKGEVGKLFFIVTHGRVSIEDIGQGDAQFAALSAGPGDWFGERSLMTNEPRAATVVAMSKTVEVSALSRDQFEAKFGSLKSLIEHEEKKRELVTIPSFALASLDDDELNKLVKTSTKVSFGSSTEIAKVGAKIVPALYIIESGRIEIISEKENAVNTLTKGDHFGGETLSPANIKSDLCSSEQHIRVVQDTVCTVLTLKTIKSVIGDVKRLGKPLPPVSAKLDRTLTLNDLRKHCILGVGGFGKVWLVQHKKKSKSSHIYALKVLNKVMLVSNDADEYVMREKNIMSSIDHPLIVNLVASFQDQTSLYMAMNFIQGGELFTRISSAWEDADGLSDWDAKFYGACIFESLSHLHKRSILFRDLKPENVLIDKFGYCVLIDLGFARVVLDRTHTICGTPDYFSPELVLGKSYNRCVDDWAFGIVLYEMLVGQSPFVQDDMTEQALFKRIVRNRWAFPNKVDHGIDVSQEAQGIIRSLMTSDPTKRLGQSPSGDDEIRRHPWFEGLLDGDKLLQRSVTAPWLPSVKDPLDTSHFEDNSSLEKTLERFGDEELPADQQHLFDGFSCGHSEGHPTAALCP